MRYAITFWPVTLSVSSISQLLQQHPVRVLKSRYAKYSHQCVWPNALHSTQPQYFARDKRIQFYLCPCSKKRQDKASFMTLFSFCQNLTLKFYLWASTLSNILPDTKTAYQTGRGAIFYPNYTNINYARTPLWSERWTRAASRDILFFALIPNTWKRAGALLKRQW